MRWSFGAKRQQAFLEDVYALVSDGVSASQAIDTIAQITEGVSQQVAQSLKKSLAQGKLLADGLQPWFQQSTVEVIRAGELGGKLQQALQAVTQTAGDKTHVVGVLLHALLYPLTVMVLALIMTVFIKNSVLESFIKIKPLATWPSIGRDLYFIASMAQTWWWLAVFFVVGCIAGIVRLLNTLTGPVRVFIDALPVLSLYREFTAARLMHTLGLLLSNGVTIKKAFSVMHQSASPYLATHLLKMEFRLSGGEENIADVLDTQLLNKNDVLRLRVIAKGKGFAHALLSLGEKAAERNSKVLQLSARIAGGLVLASGAVLAAMAVLGIYTVGSVVAG